MNIDNEYILSFRIGSLKLGISLNLIDRVIRAVQISNLPGAPPIVKGIINIRGNALPIVNFRKRLKLRPKEAIPSDNIIIVNSSTLTFGFLADEITGLKNIEHKTFYKSEDILPLNNEIVKGVMVIDDEMVLIHDIDKFLSLEEEKKITQALNKTQKA